ncbi:MAG: hypothetical protein L0922_06440, partial [Candidatus Mariimomonas ferrooxydans]
MRCCGVGLVIKNRVPSGSKVSSKAALLPSIPWSLSSHVLPSSIDLNTPFAPHYLNHHSHHLLHTTSSITHPIY